MSEQLDEFLSKHAATSTKSYVIRDRCGLRITCSGLIPITEGDEEEGAERIWGSSVILNSAELEFPVVEFKLRAKTRRDCKADVKCNRSKGRIKQNKVLVLTYQLPESSVACTTLTLIVDGSPHEIPLYKQHMADYYWIGKETKVPTAEQLYKRRKSMDQSPKMEPTPKYESPGRFDHLSDGLKQFLTENDGFKSVCRLLEPHIRSLFADLAVPRGCDVSSDDIKASINGGGGGELVDDLAMEIVRRFHASNRSQYPKTPELLRQE